MESKQVIEIGKDLIYKAGIYQTIKNEKEKKELLELFNNYEKQLQADNSKYSQTVLAFVRDLKNDLLAGRELEIENSLADEYINNYFISTREINYFNKLIDESVFNLIFFELSKQIPDSKIIRENIENLENSFINTLQILSSKTIAKNLLIFTLFKIKKPVPALNRIIVFLSKRKGFENEIGKVRSLIILYKKFIEKVKECGKESLGRKDFNLKYLKFTKNSQTSEVSMDIKISDASKENLRTGFPEFEYNILLQKL